MSIPRLGLLRCASRLRPRCHRFSTIPNRFYSSEVFQASNSTSTDHAHSSPPPPLESQSHSREQQAEEDETFVRATRERYGENLEPGILNKDQFNIYRRLYGMPTWVAPEIDAVQQQAVEDLIREFDQDLEEQQDGAWAEESVREEDEDEGAYIRHDPRTLAARSRTSPTTLSLPPSFTGPVSALLSSSTKNQLLATSFRLFGGPHFPYSPITPPRMIHLPQKPIALSATQARMGPIEADAYLAVVMPATFASIYAVLDEARRRMPTDWLSKLDRGGRVLDVGGGGAGVIAWRELLREEHAKGEEGMVSSTPPPQGRSSVVVGSEALRERLSTFLHDTTFLPRLPDVASDAQSGVGKYTYDVIIAPHNLLPFTQDWEKRNYIDHLYSLLSPKGGILVLVEKGQPTGFNAIAGAREWILKHHGAMKGEVADESASPADTATILAPCTNQGKCPLHYTSIIDKAIRKKERRLDESKLPPKRKGKSSFCHFTQRFLRPPFYQNLLVRSTRPLSATVKERPMKKTGTIIDVNPIIDNSPPEGGFDGAEESLTAHHNHTDVSYSYAIIGRNVKTEPPPLPRILLPPMKRTGHVILDVCTPDSSLERWTVPRSIGRVEYRDARKALWGDMWALDAKTKIKTVRKASDPLKGKIVREKGKRRQMERSRVREGLSEANDFSNGDGSQREL